MHSTQNEKWLNASTSFTAPACGTRPHPFHVRAAVYLSEVKNASGILRSLLTQTEADVQRRWSVSHRVKKTESQRWDGTWCCIRRCQASSTFPPPCTVAVYLSSIKLKWCLHLPGLFICLGYLRADVIRAWCSGGATSLLAYCAPSIRSSEWKIHPKIHPLGSDQRHALFHPLTVAVIQLACSPSSYILTLFTMCFPVLNT